jgi:hypothetical protein
MYNLEVSTLYIIDWSLCLCLSSHDPLLCLYIVHYWLVLMFVSGVQWSLAVSLDCTFLIGPYVCVWRPMIPCCVSRLYILDWPLCLCLASNDPLLCLYIVHSWLALMFVSGVQWSLAVSLDCTLLIGPYVCVWRPMIPCCVSRLYIIDWPLYLCLASNDPLLCL